MNYDQLPDVRDGLTREERVVLWVLSETQKERGGRNVPTTMLWAVFANTFISVPKRYQKCWHDWAQDVTKSMLSGLRIAALLNIRSLSCHLATW